MESVKLALDLTKAIKNEIILSITLAKIACITKNDEILNEALKIAKRLDLLHYSEALAKIAVEMAKNERFNDAIQLAQEVVEERFRLDALESISYYISNAGEIEKALNIALKTKYRSQRALSYVAVKAASLGYIDKAKEIATRIKDKSWKAETLAKIAVLDKKSSEVLFKDSLKIARSIKDDATKSRTLLKVAIEMAKAKFNFEEVLYEGLKIEKNDLDLLNTSIKFAEIGEVERALEIAKFIGKKQIRSEALARIARFSDANLFEKAINVARSIENEEMLIEALSKVAMEIARGGLNYDDILAEILERSKNLDEFERSKLLTNVIIDMVEIGDVKKAIELSNKISDEIYLSESLFYVVVGLLKENELNKAIETANKIFDDYWKSRAFSEIAVKISSLTI